MMIESTGMSRAAAPRSPAAGGTELGREEFLRLFLTQLQAQDPMDPMKSEEFTAQLAQFSTLEQMFNSNETLEKLLDMEQASMAVSSTSLIGKGVLVEGNGVRYDGRNDVALMYGLGAEATGATVTVFDDRGEAVTALPASAAEGEHTLSWDGRDRDGNPVAPGAYSFTVTAFDASGDEVPSWTRAVGTVDGVRVDGGVPYLRVNGRELPLSAVEQIENQPM